MVAILVTEKYRLQAPVFRPERKSQAVKAQIQSPPRRYIKKVYVLIGVDRAEKSLYSEPRL
jgi:hypothetical protein